MRYLVVRFSSLGDVVLTAPVFEALKSTPEDIHTTFLTKVEYAELHRRNPFLDEVRGYDSGKETLSSLINWVKTGEFDRIVDLHSSIRSWLISFRSGIPTVRYNQQRFRRFKMIVRFRSGAQKGLKSVVDRYLETLRLNGTDASSFDNVPKMFLNEDEFEKGRRWRSELTGEREGRLIALLPGAMHPTKQWPSVYFSELARLLAWRGDIPVIISAPGEEELSALIVKEAGGEAVKLGEAQSDLIDLASCLSAADATIANDSGPMHIAAAVGTPIMGLFGPTSPALGFAPSGSSAVCMHLGHFCSPCSKHGNRPCWRGNRYCMYDMEPEMVLNALDELFEGE
jgi:lipopolysaccharide heptosyltransferase II